MEEIEFRVLDKRLGKIFPVIRLCKDFVGDCEEPYVYYLNNRNELEWLPLSEGVLMQYTGSKDKNNQKIYEGDIIKFNNNKFDLWKVCFDRFDVRDCETGSVIDQVIGWNLKAIKTDVLSTCEPFCYDFPLTNYYIARCEAEVIGNIYENPELSGSD